MSHEIKLDTQTDQSIKKALLAKAVQSRYTIYHQETKTTYCKNGFETLPVILYTLSYPSEETGFRRPDIARVLPMKPDRVITELVTQKNLWETDVAEGLRRIVNIHCELKGCDTNICVLRRAKDEGKK